jgi:CheY-like chemotaxis protein
MSQSGRLRILLVDDNPHMRTLLRELFRGVGVHAVHEARDGAEALEILRGHRFHLVIVDQRMPGMDGIQFVRRVRRAPQSAIACVQILMLSAYTGLSDVRRARDAGVNGVLAKPISAHAVLSRIEMLSQDAQPFVRSASYVGPCRRRRSPARFPGPDRRDGGGVHVI